MTVAVLVSAATAAAAHFATVGGGISLGGGQAVVPEIVGMTESQARTMAKSVQLELQVMGTTSDPIIVKGSVARQDPLAGTQVAHGTRLIATISEGPQSSKSAAKPGGVSIPSLQRLSVPEALARLNQFGLKVGTTTHQVQSGYSSGQVIETSPSAGASVTHGAIVNLVVARAEDPPATPRAAVPRPGRAPAYSGSTVSVPKVTGMRLTFARSRLSSRGLVVGSVSHEYDEDHMENFVLRQSPANGAAVARGTTINLVVNREQ